MQIEMQMQRELQRQVQIKKVERRYRERCNKGPEMDRESECSRFSWRCTERCREVIFREKV